MQITCGIFLYSTLSNKFLICHATKAKYNVWSIPKGLKEPGENSFAAATRELWEETGIKLNEIHILEKHVLPPVKYQKSNKTLEAFLIISDSPLSEITLCCNTFVKDKYPEIDKYQWVPLAGMGNVIHESQVQHIPQIKAIIANYPIKAQFL